MASEFITGLYDRVATSYGNNQAEGLKNFTIKGDTIEFIEFGTNGAEEGETLTVNIADLGFDINEMNQFKEEKVTYGKEHTDDVVVTMSREELKAAIAECEGKITKIENLLFKEETEEKKLREQVEREQDKYERIQNEIEKATETYEENEKRTKQQAIYSAMAQYDPARDGEWEEFLQEKLKDALPKTTIESLTFSLANESKTIMRELGGLESSLLEAQGNITELNTQLSTEKVNKADFELQLALLPDPIEEIKKMVSAEEWAFVEENNLDLTEKLPDGNPRYIIANGKQDGKPHIYDMSVGGGTTLARQYGQDGGFDVIASGNGYMNNFQLADDNCADAETIMYIGECGEMVEAKATYCTSSPLSLDINGDGVKTSEEEIQYDIDGDGKMDTINDSADAILVFDKDGDGVAGADGSECFGDNTDIDGDGVKDGYKDGFEALKAFAAKEGLINGIDDNVLDENDIQILQEKYGFGVKTDGYNGEVTSLLDLGITEINLAATDETTMQDDFDGNGNQLMTQEGATFTINGETREYADIWHKKK